MTQFSVIKTFLLREVKELVFDFLVLVYQKGSVGVTFAGKRTRDGLVVGIFLLLVCARSSLHPRRTQVGGFVGVLSWQDFIVLADLVSSVHGLSVDLLPLSLGYDGQAAIIELGGIMVESVPIQHLHPVRH